LEVSASRDAPSTVSTQVAASWTFRSGHGNTVLPLSAVRLLPELDDTNTAPANRPLTVSFVIERQAGADTGAVSSVKIDVSYDDGATWHPATVQRSGATATFMLQHPASPRFVSLRAMSTDDSGNTIMQTIIHAYRIAQAFARWTQRFRGVHQAASGSGVPALRRCGPPG
jgi:hypothetical protein